MNYIYKSYKIVDEVLRKGAYSTIYLNKVLALTEEKDKKLVTKIVYGVLENNILLEYKISQLCAKKPKNSVYNLLKVGIYMLDDMELKNYAVVKETAQIAKQITKNSLTGFVNGTLKKAIDFEYTYPTETAESLSVKYSYPMWFITKMIADFGEERTRKIIQFKDKDLVSIRVRNKNFTQFKKALETREIPYIEKAGGLFSKYRLLNKSNIPKHMYVKQSRSSMLAVESFGVLENDIILDTCASPGGKSAYMAELAKNGSVTACDIHPHRVRLLESYFARMGTENAKAILKDGTIFDENFSEKFTKVLVDAPCSALGVVANKPEIKLQKSEENIIELSKIQLEILENSAKYVAENGILMYCTCTITREENAEVVKKFLSANENYQLETIDTSLLEEFEDTGFGTQIFPSDSFDGFFIAKMKRIK
ncbi:MAG: 16S rRNA (cytosine(967)-C(5))-methyltransferase RsmB [Bacillota bacterium]